MNAGLEPTVLLVEDEPQMRRFLRAALVGHGYKLIEAETVLATSPSYTRKPRMVTSPDRIRLLPINWAPSPISVPVPGTYGNAPRNLIIGPGSHQVNANFSRDVALGGSRAVTIQVTANNLLNTVNYGGIDTNINSSTFGQVTSVRGMRTVRVNMRFRF